MHNLFSGNYLPAKTTTDVISPGHLGKTFHVDKPESGVSGRPLFENDDRSRLRRIAESMAEDECRSVTAEFTPRIGVEHPNFTRLKLNPFSRSHWKPSQNNPSGKVLVRVTGLLMFDSAHFFPEPLTRDTNWEIHPVLKMEYCPSGKTCRADSDENWADLDND
jgi:hypothetical protein